jgi:hypothetical protein
VEAGERIEIGELAGLPEAHRILDRGPGASGQLLERALVPVRERA